MQVINEAFLKVIADWWQCFWFNIMRNFVFLQIFLISRCFVFDSIIRSEEKNNAYYIYDPVDENRIKMTMMVIIFIYSHYRINKFFLTAVKNFFCESQLDIYVL